MRLNLPVSDALSSCKNILISGMGGGYDVFCGLPIYFELQQAGHHVHLANYSFTDINRFEQGIWLTDSLVGVTADIQSDLAYFPELYLTQWFRGTENHEVTIWCFAKTGVRPLLENYQALVEHLDIDAILLIDGGVDSLLRGDELEIGTVVEDSISLIAVSELKHVSVRLLACLGLGAELEINYTQIFETIARLAQTDTFLGTCSLIARMDAYQKYKEAVVSVQSQPNQESSVINSSIISAVEGQFGNSHLTDKTRGSRLKISPLMPTYWFFDLPAVARRNLLFSHLRYTDNLNEAFRALLQARHQLPTRKPPKISIL